MEDYRFHIGDKVVENYNKKAWKNNTGTVIKITPKRKDITVDYGMYKKTYTKSGFLKNGGWDTSYIDVITPEMEKNMEERAFIRRCIDVFNTSEINIDQARKILAILTDKEESE